MIEGKWTRPESDIHANFFALSKHPVGKMRSDGKEASMQQNYSKTVLGEKVKGGVVRNVTRAYQVRGLDREEGNKGGGEEIPVVGPFMTLRGEDFAHLQRFCPMCKECAVQGDKGDMDALFRSMGLGENTSREKLIVGFAASSQKGSRKPNALLGFRCLSL